ncbi:MAG: SRPBCC domain-containing protein [Saprospiraceae bacterium]|nr:SRPBCC domain-containing protein [Saprospiraceae bacterium]
MYTIKHLCHIDSDQKSVYTTLTTINGLRNWWTHETEGDPAEGGELIFKFGRRFKNVMKVIKAEPNKLVEWKVIDSVPDWMNSIIRFELDRNEGKTRLKLIQSGFPEQDDFYAQCSFSWARYMMSIRDLVETGSGNPYDEDLPTD